MVAGRAGGAGGKFGLARYNPNGTLDTSFGGDGKVTTNFSTIADDFANGVASRPTGRSWPPATRAIGSLWPVTTPTGSSM